jgi:hypothetical protein
VLVPHRFVPDSIISTPAISDNSPSGATCNICDGVDIREDVEIPLDELDGVTCADVVIYSQTVDASSEVCDTYTFFEALCCPSAASTCSICKGAKLKADFIVPGTDGLSCGYVAYEAAAYEIGSENCTVYEGAEAFCCPDAENVNSPCYLCGDAGDESFDDVQIPGDATGLTCGQVALEAIDYESTSEECSALRAYADSCCPGATDPPISIPSPPPTFSPSPPPTPSFSRYVFSRFVIINDCIDEISAVP